MSFPSVGPGKRTEQSNINLPFKRILIHLLSLCIYARDFLFLPASKQVSEKNLILSVVSYRTPFTKGGYLMKEFLKITSVALAAVTFTGCHCMDSKGTLTVNSDLKIKNHHVLNRTVTYAPGTYNVELKYHPMSERIEIRGLGHKKVRFKLPMDYFKNGESVQLKGSEIGEDFNVIGKVTQTITQSAPYSYKSVCNLTWSYWYPIYGEQVITAHDQTTVREVYLNFVKPDQVLSLASLSTTNTDTEMVVDTYSPCQ
jgi:hypothetical protein